MKFSVAKIFSNSEKEEVIEDKLLRDITREFIQWLFKILYVSSISNTNINSGNNDLSTDIKGYFINIVVI